MRITVLEGGPSAEREVSLVSGQRVAAALRQVGHEVAEVDAAEESVRALRPEQQDVVFIALHGPFGEDGTVQDLLERAGIRYTGSDARASRLAMDKVAAKEAMREAGVFTPAAVVARAENLEADVAALSPLGLPVVVKPACQGSSIGVTIVREAAHLRPALAAAFEYGPAALVEQYVSGRELTVGVLGEEALPVIELKPAREFYDYSAKYVGHQTEYVVNPDLPQSTVAAVQQMALRAYRALGCRDFGRVDLILDPWQRPFVLEVNTIPGFTDHSLLPMAARAVGFSFEDLVSAIVNLAMKRSALGQ